jgi:hypothetical protein
MSWYFFDSRDDGVVDVDDIGLEVADLETVQVLAAKGLTELALEVLPGCSERSLGIEVRDAANHPVLTTELNYKARLIPPV